MMRWIPRLLAYAVFVVLLAYLVDTAVWVARGRQLSQVEIQQVTAASQKGNKEEYFLDQTISATCAQRWFPLPTTEGLVAPCWWTNSHREHIQRL